MSKHHRGQSQSRVSAAKASRLQTPMLSALYLAVSLAATGIAPRAMALDASTLPTGATTVSGTIAMSTSGHTLTVNQASDKAIINWQQFNIGSGAAVRFVQPSSAAKVLNRVTGGASSQIMGSLSANGQVYIINPAGVLIGAGAQVNLGGLVASTLHLSDDDFNAGRDRFTLGQDSTGSVINQGSITAAQGGRIVLLGSTVKNNGTLSAPGGDVAMGSGRQITLSAGANGHLQMSVDAADVATLVSNGGLVQADGGQIIMTAKGANGLASAVVSNTGTLQAQTVDNHGGRILLLADTDHGGTTNVAGTLDASAPILGNGGTIETSGAKVKVAASTRVDTRAQQGSTGTWLIDPADFTISPGSDAQTASGIGANTLSAALATTNVTQATGSSSADGNGDIIVNAPVTWSANTTLTLNAFHDILFNAAVTATGTSAGLVLNYANNYQVNAPVTLSGANASLRLNGQAYALLHSMADLNNINSRGLQGNYALAQDINASGTTYTSALIGNGSSDFAGTFAGLGHTLDNLTITANTGNAGLFYGLASIALVRDVNLRNVAINGTGASTTGAVTGTSQGIVQNVSISGAVQGDLFVGGAVGFNLGSLQNVQSAANVTGLSYVGGLVGWNIAGSVLTSNASGNVNGQTEVGGLIGYNTADVEDSSASGSVIGIDAVGALMGDNFGTSSNNQFILLGDRTVQASNGTVNLAGGVSQGVGVTNKTLSVIGNDILLPDTLSLPDNNLLLNASNSINPAGAVLASRFTLVNGSWAQLGVDGQLPMFLVTDFRLGSGAGFLRAVDGDGSTAAPYQIQDIYGLQGMGSDALRSDAFVLNNNLDASGTSGWNAGAGFLSIGAANPFQGSFDGGYHVIDGLFINSSTDYSGLFGKLGVNATVQRLGLTNANVSGQNYAGLVAGNSAASQVSEVFATGQVTGLQSVGGLLGYNSGLLRDSYSTANVTGQLSVGGLVGANRGTVTNTFASGTVIGASEVDGLIGLDNGPVSGSFGSLDGSSLSRYLTAGWSIDDQGGTPSLWRFYQGQSAPLLRGFLTPLSVDVDPASKNFDASATSTLTYTLPFDADPSLIGGSLHATATSAVAGHYSVDDGNLALSGLYSGQQGYDISYSGGVLDIAAVTPVTPVTPTEPVTPVEPPVVVTPPTPVTPVEPPVVVTPVIPVQPPVVVTPVTPVTPVQPPAVLPTTPVVAATAPVVRPAQPITPAAFPAEIARVAEQTDRVAAPGALSRLMRRARVSAAPVRMSGQNLGLANGALNIQEPAIE